MPARRYIVSPQGGGGVVGLGLKAYLNSIKGSKCVAGITPDIFAGFPLRSVSFGTGGIDVTFAANNVTVGTPNYPGPGGPATGLVPGGFNCFMVAPPSGNSAWGLSGVSNAPPNDSVSIMKASAAKRCINSLVVLLANPTPGANPFTTNGGVLNIGSGAYNQLIANLTALLPNVLAVTNFYPTIFALQGELNLGGGGFTDPACWFASNVCTSTQAAEVFHIVKTFYVSQGVQALWGFEFNLGVGSYLFGFPGPQILAGTWSHGASDADIILYDSVPMYFDSSALTAANSTGLLQGYGSAIPEQQSQSGCNLFNGANMPITNGAQGIGFQAVLAGYPNCVLYYLWGQFYTGGTLSACWNWQLGSLQCLTNPFLAASNIPLLTSI